MLKNKIILSSKNVQIDYLFRNSITSFSDFAYRDTGGLDFSFFSNREYNLLMATGSDMYKVFCSRYLEAIFTPLYRLVLPFNNYTCSYLIYVLSRQNSCHQTGFTTTVEVSSHAKTSNSISS
jgi:hypothetical protein